MSAEPLTCPARFAVLAALVLICAGCATALDGNMPVENTASGVPVPSSTRVLGQATLYISATGERLEVIHDASAGIAILKLPDGRGMVLPEEIAGSEGRYRDKHMTLWENTGFALLWVDGKLVFTGRIAN